MKVVVAVESVFVAVESSKRNGCAESCAQRLFEVLFFEWQESQAVTSCKSFSLLSRLETLHEQHVWVLRLEKLPAQKVKNGNSKHRHPAARKATEESGPSLACHQSSLEILRNS